MSQPLTRPVGAPRLSGVPAWVWFLMAPFLIPLHGGELLGQAPQGTSLAGQSSSASAGAAPSSQPDFLFRTPRVSLGLRAGVLQAREGSDIYDFFSEELTLEAGDFDGIAFLGELGIAFTDRADLVLGVEHSRASQRSEFREWVGDDGLPIEQVTSLRTTPLTVGARLYLLPRGESVGRFVWIPSDFAPYVGAGLGAIAYQLEQEGEFVDFEDLGIFRDRFTSTEWGSTFHVTAGADLRMGRRTFLTGEARYRRASGGLGSDFVGFDPIDLSGLTATVGITVRY